MKRLHFLALIVALEIVFGFACGKSSSSGGGGGSADDDSGGCGSAASIQCEESAAATLSTCNKSCESLSGCAQLNCSYNCDVQYQPVLLACLTQYDCPGQTEHECIKACDQTGIQCLSPLSNCTDAQVISCGTAQSACVINCQTAG